VGKILLEGDNVNPNRPDTYSRALLRCAAENVPEGLAKVQLEGDDLNTDKQDNRGQN